MTQKLKISHFFDEFDIKIKSQRIEITGYKTPSKSSIIQRLCFISLKIALKTSNRFLVKKWNFTFLSRYVWNRAKKPKKSIFGQILKNPIFWPKITNNSPQEPRIVFWYIKNSKACFFDQKLARDLVKNRFLVQNWLK